MADSDFDIGQEICNQDETNWGNSGRKKRGRQPINPSLKKQPRVARVWLGLFNIYKGMAIVGDNTMPKNNVVGAKLNYFVDTFLVALENDCIEDFLNLNPQDFSKINIPFRTRLATGERYADFISLDFAKGYISISEIEDEKIYDWREKVSSDFGLSSPNIFGFNTEKLTNVPFLVLCFYAYMYAVIMDTLPQEHEVFEITKEANCFRASYQKQNLEDDVEYFMMEIQEKISKLEPYRGTNYDAQRGIE